MELRLMINGKILVEQKFIDHDLSNMNWYERAEFKIGLEDIYLKRFKKENQKIIKDNPGAEIVAVMESKMHLENLKIAV